MAEVCEDNDFTKNSPAPRTVRWTYLNTYSQVVFDIFLTWESFGSHHTESFDYGSGKVTVEHCACSLEKHRDGRVALSYVSKT